MDPITFQRRLLIPSGFQSTQHSRNSSFNSQSCDYSGYPVDATIDVAQRREAIRLQKRQRMLERERTRWERLDEEFHRQVAKIETLSEKLKRVKKRNISEAYNPVNGEYDWKAGGGMLFQADETAYYRAKIRNSYIASKRNNGFNIISGQTQFYPVLPKFHILQTN